MIPALYTQVELVSDDDEDDEDEEVMSVATPGASVPEDKYRAQSLEKMIALVAMLVEKSRGDDNVLHLSNRDLLAIMQGRVRKFGIFSRAFRW